MKVLSTKEKLAREKAYKDYIAKLKVETNIHSEEHVLIDDDGLQSVQLFEYIRISELPEEDRPEFSQWMYGQTCPLIKKEVFPETKFKKFLYKLFNMQKFEIWNDCAYYWDFERWKVSKHFQTPTYFD